MTAKTLIAQAYGGRYSRRHAAARREFLRRVTEDPAGLAAEIAAMIPEDQRGKAYTWMQGQLFDRRDG